MTERAVAPFRYDLVPFGEGNLSLRTFAERPDLVVRSNGNFGSITDTIARTVRFKNALGRLSTYGIQIPNPKFVIGPDVIQGGAFDMYTVCDKVEGDVIKASEEIPASVYQQTLHSLVSYYEDVVRDGGDYIDDLYLLQCMHGTTKRDPQPKTYLVDLDINLRTFGDTMPADVIELFYADQYAIAKDIEAYTTYYGQSGVNLAQRTLDTVNRLPEIPTNTRRFFYGSVEAETRELLHELITGC